MLVVGNESRGPSISAATAAHADLLDVCEYAHVGMRGGVESLNVAVASALLMQRFGPGPEQVRH